MNCDRLPPGYVMKQRERVRRVAGFLDGRDQAVRAGRAIPFPGSLANGRGRHLQASILFLDICGFSNRQSTTAAQQDEILTAFALLFPELIAIIEDYDGTVEKNTGDGLMAYFVNKDGVHHVQRAIACAMTMLDVTQRLINPQLRRRQIEPFSFRISIDCGNVTIAQVGRKTGFSGMVAISSFANVASKMLRHADPNSILLGDSAAMQVPTAWSHHLVHKPVEDWTWNCGGVPYALWTFNGVWTDPIPQRVLGAMLNG